MSEHERASRSRLEQQATKILGEARAEANRVLRTARVEADEILEQAKVAARAIRAEEFALDLRGKIAVLDVSSFEDADPTLADETLDDLIAGAVSCAVRRAMRPTKVLAGRYLVVQPSV